MDHTAGMQHLPKDICVVIGKDEPTNGLGPLFYQDNFVGVEYFNEINFDSTYKLTPLGHCADVFGDGSLWAIQTPGHRKGHISFLINGKQDVVLITGDACDIKMGFDYCVGPGFGSYNSKKAQQSLEQLRNFANTYQQVKVFFGHELP